MGDNFRGDKICGGTESAPTPAYTGRLVACNTCATQARRLVGRRGGVRESNKVELIKSGGGSRRGRSPLSPS